MPLINCKIHLKLNWTKNCLISDNSRIADNSNNNNTEFKIVNTKLCVPIVTLSTEGNVKLIRQLNE